MFCIHPYFVRIQEDTVRKTEEKHTAFQSMTWSLIVHKNTVNNCSAAPQAFPF